jgi:hypothetical protein
VLRASEILEAGDLDISMDPSTKTVDWSVDLEGEIQGNIGKAIAVIQGTSPHLQIELEDLAATMKTRWERVTNEQKEA